MKNLSLSFLLLIGLSYTWVLADSPPDLTLNPTMMNYIQAAQQDFDNIPDERKKQLRKMALFIQTKIKAGEEAWLIFICTHNSRRSHMSQLWARVAADYYEVPNVHTFSGGTEATAFNPRAVAALERAGFAIEKTSEGDNPHYQVTYSPDTPAQEAFSKKYDDPVNPPENFAAIMTCSQADKNCPFVPGATLRIAIPYEDPKEADGTPEEAARYDERSKQIATEMLYCFSQIKGL